MLLYLYFIHKQNFHALYLGNTFDQVSFIMWNGLKVELLWEGLTSGTEQAIQFNSLEALGSR